MRFPDLGHPTVRCRYSRSPGRGRKRVGPAVHGGRADVASGSHPDLVLGALFPALAPLVWLARARTHIGPVGAKGEENSLWFERLVSTGFKLIGISPILLEVSEDIDLDLLISKGNNSYSILMLMAGVLASRAILSVILVDGLLAILFHTYRAEKAGAPAETAQCLGRKISSLGTAPSDVGPPSTAFDGR